LGAGYFNQMPIQIVSICAHKIALYSTGVGEKLVVFSRVIAYNWNFPDRNHLRKIRLMLCSGYP
jgi:hypothetical protein